ncbi:MAG: DUF6503 family protein [Bacteroidota bacterium]
MRSIIYLIIILPFICKGQSVLQILDKSLAYHDSKNNWSTLKSTFHFKETRPSEADRFTVVTLDNSVSFMKINRNEEEVYELKNNAAEVLKGNRDKDRALVLRDYYLYLWGLPMKLRDESTPQMVVTYSEKVEGNDTYVLRVPYDEDTWYFYFDKNSGKMLQYKFYQDKEESKGELITLEGEVLVQGIKIPQKRSWYTLPEMKYLGTDILERVD